MHDSRANMRAICIRSMQRRKAGRHIHTRSRAPNKRESMYRVCDHALARVAYSKLLCSRHIESKHPDPFMEPWTPGTGDQIFQLKYPDFEPSPSSVLQPSSVHFVTSSLSFLPGWITDRFSRRDEVMVSVDETGKCGEIGFLCLAFSMGS